MLNNKNQVTVKVTLEHAIKAQKRCITLFFLTSVLVGGGWSPSLPGRFTPRKETWYLLFMGLGGPQDRSERVREISPSTGIRSPGLSIP